MSTDKIAIDRLAKRAGSAAVAAVVVSSKLSYLKLDIYELEKELEKVDKAELDAKVALKLAGGVVWSPGRGGWPEFHQAFEAAQGEASTVQHGSFEGPNLRPQNIAVGDVVRAADGKLYEAVETGRPGILWEPHKAVETVTPVTYAREMAAEALIKADRRTIRQERSCESCFYQMNARNNGECAGCSTLTTLPHWKARASAE